MKAGISTFVLASVTALLLGGFNRDAHAVPILQQVSPISGSYVFDTDFTYMSYSGVGDVTAAVSAVDLALFPGNSSTSGCEAADFAGFTVGHIALIQRGTCTFYLKAINAYNAGAVGVLIMNQGNSVGTEGLFNGTLTSAFNVPMPVLATTYTVGLGLANIPGTVVRMAVDVSVPPTVSPPPPPGTSIPEPGMLSLMLLALLYLGGMSRSKTGACRRP